MVDDEKQEPVEPPRKCLKCGNDTTNFFWIYRWEGKSGNTCENCGVEIHNIGYYLLEKAVDLFKKHGMTIGTSKEKFGRFEIYVYPETEEQKQLVRETQEFYTRAYPEFDWEFR